MILVRQDRAFGTLAFRSFLRNIIKRMKRDKVKHQPKQNFSNSEKTVFLFYFAYFKLQICSNSPIPPLKVAECLYSI